MYIVFNKLNLFATKLHLNRLSNKTLIMLNQIRFILFLFITSVSVSAQLKGTIIDVENQPIPYVNIYLENSYTGSTSNDNGDYVLALSKPGTYTVVFQYLGFKTQTKTLEIKEFPFTLDVTLLEENISLNEVVIDASENPANRIVRAAIKNRKNQLEKINSFAADFYSKGLIRIDSLPEKFMGQEIKADFGLDSTRSGIIYLSETISKIKYQKPDKLTEKIIASKVSGDSNGFSFNNAIDVDYNFYNNTVEINSEIISPIAEYAFNYYRYNLEGVFYDDRGNLINKIKVIPRRKNDPVFSGSIYIVEDQWALFGLELQVNGSQIQTPIADSITIKQNLSYDENENHWIMRSQTIGFEFGFLGFNGDGSFVANYSNYTLNPRFESDVFSNEILVFEGEANKKDSTYWNTLRPVPLTDEELKDYIKKDSIQTLKASKTYRDSVDLENNKFRFGNLLSGYSYDRSFQNKSLRISSPLSGISLNTVQGYNSNLKLDYTKRYNKFKNYLSIGGLLNYSFDTEKMRGNLGAVYKFNNTDDLTVGLFAEINVKQFNTPNPISNLVNSISTLFFEDNYMKLYESRFVGAMYSQELFNGFRIKSSLIFADRRALFNISEYTPAEGENTSYTSNNPIDPLNYDTAPFENHKIIKFKLDGSIRFGQKYLSYPGSKFNISNSKYPKLNFRFEKGMSASNSDYNFEHLSVNLNQSLELENKGSLSYSVVAGTFFNNSKPAFMDFKHFDGNQTHINLNSDSLTSFKNLAYYDFSTSENYTEYHLEHNFNGFLLGKIPLINKLNYNLIVGLHGFSTKNQKPYKEFSLGIDNIGWGKYRLLRIDYVRSYKSEFVNDAFLFGISF